MKLWAARETPASFARLNIPDDFVFLEYFCIFGNFSGTTTLPLYLVSAGDFAARHVENNPLFVSVVDLIVFVVMSSQLFHGGAGGDVSRTQIIPEGSTSNLSRQTGFDAVKEIVLRVSLGMETMVGPIYLSLSFWVGILILSLTSSAQQQ